MDLFVRTKKWNLIKHKLLIEVMKKDRYEDVIAASDFLEFEFTSVGPKGSILKLVQFTSTGHPDIFNLAFGNKTSDGFLDDLAIDDNMDRNKILATVSTTVYEFCKHYPDKWIFFSGSTLARTRLYRMAIALNYEELTMDFQIFGVLQDINGDFENAPFQKAVDFFGFLIQKK